MRNKDHRIQPSMTRRARDLRREMTVPERILWGHLRSGRLGGLKFRRQVAFGRYVADFYCASAKLVIELDGMSHVGTGEEDDERTRDLEERGLRIVRVTNDELFGSFEAVLNHIARAAGLDW